MHYATKTYRMHIVCMSGPGLYIMQWLFCNSHMERREQISLHIHTRHKGSNTWLCTPSGIESVHGTGLPYKKKEIDQSIRQYWPINKELAMMESIAMKGNWIIIPFQLQKWILQQLHSNNIGIEKMRILVH